MCYFLAVRPEQHVELTTVKAKNIEPQSQYANSTVSTITPPRRFSPSSTMEILSSSSVTTSPSPQPSSTTSSPPKKQSHNTRKHVLVTSEEAHSKMLWSTSGVRGAVVALTLGIIITLLTLVYIACHYRHQQRITRRHRHLSAGSNDADYLVNGMYL